MVAKRKGLGRGLSHLISNNAANAIAEATGDATSGTVADGELKELPIEFLRRGRYQPRRDFPQESLQELADSIRTQGIIQPIVVRLIGEQAMKLLLVNAVGAPPSWSDWKKCRRCCAMFPTKPPLQWR